MACAMLQADDLGAISGELRAFSFDRSFDHTAPHSRAVTVGGIVKYTTPVTMDLSATIGYYTSMNTNIYTDKEGKGTSLLQTDGSNLGFFGEANVKYDNGIVQLIGGRQRLSTPLANDHDLRLLPSAYQGVTAQYKPLGITLGHITAYSGFGSKYDEFLGIPHFDFVSFSNYDVNAQIVLSNIRDYYYVDYSKTLGDIVLKGQYGANNNAFDKDSQMYGVKASYIIGDSSVSVLGNTITGNRWLSIESGAMFTDWMQGYGLYEPSNALGIQFSNTNGKLSTTLGAVKVSGGVTDDYVEYQTDLIYQINNSSKVRIRYSLKDQTAESNREDRNDLRVIYYYAF
jgi:hypothetical protein